MVAAMYVPENAPYPSQKVRGQTYRHQVVLVDDHYFINCTFEACKIVFTGEKLVWFDGCDFIECQWVLGRWSLRTEVPGARSVVAAPPGCTGRGVLVFRGRPGEPRTWSASRSAS